MRVTESERRESVPSATPLRIFTILLVLSVLAGTAAPTAVRAGTISLSGVVGNRIGNAVLFNLPVSAIPPAPNADTSASALTGANTSVNPNQLPSLQPGFSWQGIKNFVASGPGATTIDKTSPTDNKDWSGSQYTRLVINQNAPQAVIDWASFNIGASGSVYFKQPTGGVALNRIWDNYPSYIYGSLGANGAIYLINQNGILFGPTAQVDVHTLIASSLNLAQADFLANALNFSTASEVVNNQTFDTARRPTTTTRATPARSPT